ncbi:helix-turn-helix transcriptional regulator [Rhizomonospora bruguierae]|uniref:helix-turn-helix transcriptional regulator n=1 Tax=Rhizomonospora bruguierae TaxID=1581705 RepID=UPI001BCB29EB|nr:helix-turn-helix domain-containing protein [Micromonospora sp. NBRC 107566]
MKTARPGPSGETIDTPQHRALASASRVAILRLIRAADTGLTGAEVAQHTGLHPSTVRAHLERLVQAGLLVKARASGGGPGRPAWRYRGAAPEPAPAPYRTLAAALLEHLATTGGGVPTAVQAGRAWGRQLGSTTDTPGDEPTGGPVDTAVGVLRRLGFDPRLAPGTGRHRHPGDSPAAGDAVEVHLHTCPFLELVGQHPDVMCGLHAGMVSGVLHAAGAPDGEAVLEPFAAPTACVVRLRVPAPGAPDGQR